MVAPRRVFGGDTGYSARPVGVHVDLIRHDYKGGSATAVARIHLVDGAYGLLVENLGGAHCEANVFAALGETARAPASEIAAALTRLFDGPYLVASDPHGDGDC